MNTHVDKTQEYTLSAASQESLSVANGKSQKQSGDKSAFQFVDNRPEALAQRKLQEVANNSPLLMQLRAFQKIANNSPQERTLTSPLPIQLRQLKSNQTTEVVVQRKANLTAAQRTTLEEHEAELERMDDALSSSITIGNYLPAEFFGLFDLCEREVNECIATGESFGPKALAVIDSNMTQLNSMIDNAIAQVWAATEEEEEEGPEPEAAPKEKETLSLGYDGFNTARSKDNPSLTAVHIYHPKWTVTRRGNPMAHPMFSMDEYAKKSRKAKQRYLKKFRGDVEVEVCAWGIKTITQSGRNDIAYFQVRTNGVIDTLYNNKKNNPTTDQHIKDQLDPDGQRRFDEWQSKR